MTLAGPPHTMDVNTLRILVTLASFAAFAGIVAWTWSKRRSAGFDEAANLPFRESVPPGAAPADEGTERGHG